MYKYIKKDGFTNILRTTDSVVVPINLANTDYQVYLKWLEEGNEPLPAEE